MSIPRLTILRDYARYTPDRLPASILYHQSEKNYTILDAYPKAIFHYLVLPRILPGAELEPSSLENLRSLMKADKGKAKRVIESLAKDAQIMKADIDKEMIRMYGFKWDVHMGFHAKPSMVHLHLHIISSDLVSIHLKTKKHYNTFRPDLGFFIHLEEVLSWFEAVPSFFNNVVRRLDRPSEYEAKLKEDLVCFHCYEEMRNMPILKEHLQEEFNKKVRAEERRAEARLRLERLRSPTTESQTNKQPLDELEEKEAKSAKSEEEGQEQESSDWQF